MRDQFPIQNQNVAYTVIEEQAVLVSPEDSSMYWLNPVASCIWERVNGRNSIETIAQAVCNEYEIDFETALRDATSMIEAFTAKQLIFLAKSEMTYE